MAVYPASSSFSVLQGSTFDFTLTLTSGNSSVPMNLTGCTSNLVIGPYITLSSTTPTTSGNVGINTTTGQISITLSGVATYIYSPQPYYVSLTTPSGALYYILNGRMDFISPFNQPSTSSSSLPLMLGSFDLSIEFTNFDDLQPVFVPSPPPPNPLGSAFGNIDLT